jgi:hypothetical protein
MIIPLVWALPLTGAVAEPDVVTAPVIPGVVMPRVDPDRPEPWIGLEVSQLHEAMRAHVSIVPDGVGFVVTKVEDGGPAAEAGIQRFDILWKFEDQLLVNEAQFGTLLRLKAPGDPVDFGIVRSGQPQVIEVTVGKMPEQKEIAGVNPSEIPIFPNGVPGLTRQVVFPQDRTAEVTRPDGSVARLRYEEDGPVVRIEDSSGEVIFDGALRRDGKFAVPDEWRSTVGALLRSMHRSERDDWQPRRPRPRVVRPPSTADSGN